jgi:hypothetical protein
MEQAQYKTDSKELSSLKINLMYIVLLTLIIGPLIMYVSWKWSPFVFLISIGLDVLSRPFLFVPWQAKSTIDLMVSDILLSFAVVLLSLVFWGPAKHIYFKRSL